LTDEVFADALVVDSNIRISLWHAALRMLESRTTSKSQVLVELWI
jgi:hypothetical protein